MLSKVKAGEERPNSEQTIRIKNKEKNAIDQSDTEIQVYIYDASMGHTTLTGEESVRKAKLLRY